MNLQSETGANAGVLSPLVSIWATNPFAGVEMAFKGKESGTNGSPNRSSIINLNGGGVVLSTIPLQPDDTDNQREARNQ